MSPLRKTLASCFRRDPAQHAIAFRPRMPTLAALPPDSLARCQAFNIEFPTRTDGQWDSRHRTHTLYTVYINIADRTSRTGRMGRMGRTVRISRIVIMIYTVGSLRSHAQEAIVQLRRQDIQHHASEGAAGGCRGGGPPSRPKYVSACAPQQATWSASPMSSISVCAPMTISCSCSVSLSQSRASDRPAVSAKRAVPPSNGTSPTDRQLSVASADLAPDRKLQALGVSDRYDRTLLVLKHLPADSQSNRRDEPHARTLPTTERR